jgi:hypothetical protein
MADIPLDPRLQSQLLDLYRLSGDRLASTQPVHDAAMAMATRLAPGYARAAMRPTPTPSAPLTTGDLGQTGGTSTAGKVTAAALASLLANGGPGGASGNLGKLIQDLVKLFRRGNDPNNYALKPGDGFGGPNTSTFGGRDPFADVLPGYDPGFNDPAFFNGMPTDPSGGTGVGPGMQGYRNDPPGGDPSPTTGTNWWDE